MCIRHEYSKWGVPTDAYNGSIKQSRVCKKCGKIQVRDLGYQDGLGAIGVLNSLKDFIKYCKKD